jgi:FAD synthetase
MKNTKTVLATGAFDLLHYGHLKFLEESKKIGGKNSRLVVLVARDSTATRLKGKKPIMSENERRMLVASLKPVDEAVLGYRKFSIRKVIQRIKPDFIALGYDQDEDGLKIKIVQIRRFGSPDLSSSRIKRRVIKNWGRL